MKNNEWQHQMDEKQRKITSNGKRQQTKYDVKWMKHWVDEGVSIEQQRIDDVVKRMKAVGAIGWKI